jgi:hypothetical protein
MKVGIGTITGNGGFRLSELALVGRNFMKAPAVIYTFARWRLGPVYSTGGSLYSRRLSTISRSLAILSRNARYRDWNYIFRILSDPATAAMHRSTIERLEGDGDNRA